MPSRTARDDRKLEDARLLGNAMKRRALGSELDGNSTERSAIGTERIPIS